MPKGGKRAGAGRKPGSRNKATAELKELAQPYAPRALSILSEIMENEAAPSAARATAANSILDRAYGKAPQALTNADDKPLAIQIVGLDEHA